MKYPFQKASTDGRLYLDTSEPSFKEWFLKQITQHKHSYVIQHGKGYWKCTGCGKVVRSS